MGSGRVRDGLGGSVMTWDPVWEAVFRSQAWGRYPPEELIRFVARNYYDTGDRSQVRILDAGCGPGSGVWYLAREGFSAAGIDGSETAVARAAERLAADGLDADLRVGDIARLADFYQAGTFNAVIDVTSIQHQPLASIEAIHDAVLSILKPGGRMFAMMVGRGSWGDGLGREIEPGTFVEIAEGPLRGKGTTHFSTLEEVERVFSARFRDVEINVSSRTLDHRRQTYMHWVVEAVRP